MIKKIEMILLAVVLLLAVNVVSAELIRDIDLDFVTIGNAVNAADITGYGTVEYDYSIGKHEITNAQWNIFAAAAGVPTGNPTGAYDLLPHWTGTDIPTTNLSWFEAAQFCNYLTSGDKSKGAYQFSGNNANPGDFIGIDRNSAVSTYGVIYVIPTEDEWYKAAYYTGSGYSTYANGTSINPTNGVESNYGSAGPWNVGSGTIEQNGTFDMMGNVWEWNETLVDYDRVFRGGAFNQAVDTLSSSYRLDGPESMEPFNLGFRIASVVPEPCSLVLLSVGGLMLRRRKR